MICDCGSKMKCVFTFPDPRNERTRFRVYKCSCGAVDETLEVPERNITSEDAKATLRRLREGRFKFLMSFKKKG